MARRITIDKDAFLRALSCDTQGWLALRGVDETPSPSDRLRMDEGQKIHRRARALHPDGHFAGDLETTTQLIRSKRSKVVFEAAFEAGRYTARADWVRRVRGGWVIGEVKSSLYNEAGPKGEHIDDLAYTVSVARRSGLAIKGAELILLNKSWRLGMPDDELFVIVDVTDHVEERCYEFDQIWDTIETRLVRLRRPRAGLCWECRNCEHFANACIGDDIEHPLWKLPRLRQSRFDELLADGVVDVLQISTDHKISEKQRVVVDAIHSQAPIIDRDTLHDRLNAVEWPAGYLDFETIMLAIPPWPKIAPYEQILTQYSIHVCSSPGVIDDHREYLADPDRDCRRELAERLIDDLADCRSIVVYSAFESQRIGDLAKRFRKLTRSLNEIRERLFDLEPVVRDGMVHPEFGGRTSIKVVLPVLAPDLSYGDLAVSDGGEAMAAFVGLMRGEYQGDEAAEVRRALFKYCKLDTLAMVRIHEALEQVLE